MLSLNWNIFNSSTHWVDKPGKIYEIKDMETTHINNTIEFLRRQYPDFNDEELIIRIKAFGSLLNEKENRKGPVKDYRPSLLVGRDW